MHKVMGRAPKCHKNFETLELEKQENPVPLLISSNNFELHRDLRNGTINIFVPSERKPVI